MRYYLATSLRGVQDKVAAHSLDEYGLLIKNEDYRKIIIKLENALEKVQDVYCPENSQIKIVMQVIFAYTRELIKSIRANEITIFSLETRIRALTYIFSQIKQHKPIIESKEDCQQIWDALEAAKLHLELKKWLDWNKSRLIEYIEEAQNRREIKLSTVSSERKELPLQSNSSLNTVCPNQIAIPSNTLSVEECELSLMFPEEGKYGQILEKWKDNKHKVGDTLIIKNRNIWEKHEFLGDDEKHELTNLSFIPTQTATRQRDPLTVYEEIKTSLATVPRVVGAAYGEGDCFFDSVAQGLQQSGIPIPINDNHENFKKLRLLCRKYVIDLRKKNPDRDDWVSPLIKLDGGDYNQYIMNIQWSNPEIMQEFKAGNTRRSTAIWGSPHIDGRIICAILGIKLHVLEFQSDPENKSILIPFHNLVDALGSTAVNAGDIDYNDPKVIHIAGAKLHFVPLLSATPQQNNGQNINDYKIEREATSVEQKVNQAKQFKVTTIPASSPLGIKLAEITNDNVSTFDKTVVRNLLNITSVGGHAPVQNAVRTLPLISQHINDDEKKRAESQENKFQEEKKQLQEELSNSNTRANFAARQLRMLAMQRGMLAIIFMGALVSIFGTERIEHFCRMMMIFIFMQELRVLSFSSSLFRPVLNTDIPRPVPQRNEIITTVGNKERIFVKYFSKYFSKLYSCAEAVRLNMESSLSNQERSRKIAMLGILELIGLNPLSADGILQYFTSLWRSCRGQDFRRVTYLFTDEDDRFIQVREAATIISKNYRNQLDQLTDIAVRELAACAVIRVMSYISSNVNSIQVHETNMVTRTHDGYHRICNPLAGAPGNTLRDPKQVIIEGVWRGQSTDNSAHWWRELASHLLNLESTLNNEIKLEPNPSVNSSHHWTAEGVFTRSGILIDGRQYIDIRGDRYDQSSIYGFHIGTEEERSRRDFRYSGTHVETTPSAQCSS